MLDTLYVIGKPVVCEGVKVDTLFKANYVVNNDLAGKYIGVLHLTNQARTTVTDFAVRQMTAKTLTVSYTLGAQPRVERYVF